MKRKLFFAAILTLSVIAAAQKAPEIVKIEDIFDNPGKYENEQVTIQGIVNQYFAGTTQTTSYYIVMGDFGGVMNVNTSDKAPDIFKSYKISGVVVMDQVQGRPVLIEKSRTPVVEKNSIIIYVLIGAVILLLVFIAIYVLRGQKSTEPSYDNKPADGPRQTSSSDSSSKDYETIRVSTGPPPTMVLIPGELEIMTGLDKGKSFRIAGYPTADGSIVTIGRESVEGDRKYAHIQLMEKTVSRKQAEIIYKNGVLYIKNLSETNFTQIDGVAIRSNESAELRPGAIIRTGEVEFKYKR